MTYGKSNTDRSGAAHKDGPHGSDTTVKTKCLDGPLVAGCSIAPKLFADNTKKTFKYTSDKCYKKMASVILI